MLASRTPSHSDISMERAHLIQDTESSLYCTILLLLYHMSGWPSGLRRQTQGPALVYVRKSRWVFWSSIEGVGSNPTSDKLFVALFFSFFLLMMMIKYYCIIIFLFYNLYPPYQSPNKLKITNKIGNFLNINKFLHIY